MRQDQNFFKLY